MPKKDLHATKGALLKKNRLVYAILTASLVILAVTYIANGFELKDAWLYVYCVGLIVFAGIHTYTSKK